MDAERPKLSDWPRITKRMNNTTNIQTETPRPVRCSAWLGGVLMRDWTATGLQWWPRDSERTNWHATLNNIEIGGYSTKPSEHWTGVYCWFGNTKFVPFPESEEQARAWIEAKLKEWIIEAVAVMRPVPPNKQLTD